MVGKKPLLSQLTAADRELQLTVGRHHVELSKKYTTIKSFYITPASTGDIISYLKEDNGGD